MISDKQKKILAFPYSRYTAIICDGAIRSGKTSVSFVAYVDWIMRNYNEQEFILLGVSVGAARRNVVEPYTRLGYALKRYKLDHNRSSNTLTVKRGNVSNKIRIFGAPNERSYEPILGMTAAGCFIDQVEICNRKAVETALGRCSVDGSKYFFNCNPAYPTHWFYEEWILKAQEMNALYLRFEMDDNPGLSEEIKERFSRQYSGVFHDRYIKGLWVVAEGLIYQFNDKSEYTCSNNEALGIYKDEKGEERQRGGTWYISIDYGITNPFAALLWRVESDKAYVVDEYYFDSKRENRRKTDKEHYDSVVALAEGHNIEGIIIDPSATSFKEEIWRGNRFSAYDADNSVVEGIMTTDSLLRTGKIKINESCTNTIAEMQVYRWDDKKNDVPVKENDHAADCLRYLSNTVLKYEIM